MKEWYPDEHPFIRNTTNSDDPNETLYSLTMSGFPLYKRSYVTCQLDNKAPLGFKRNEGTNYIDFPIQQLCETKTQQAQYTQAIIAPNPLVIALHDNTDKVYSKPLYAAPIYQYDGKPVYTTAELDYLKADAQGREFTDRMIERVGDLSLQAEVHRFWVVTAKLEHMEQVLVENEEAWGQLASAKLGTIRHLEMADAITQINKRNDGFIDDALHTNNELLHGRRT